MAISLFLGGSKRLPRWFGALTVFRSIQPCRMVKMAKCRGVIKRNGSSLRSVAYLKSIQKLMISSCEERGTYTYLDTMLIGAAFEEKEGGLWAGRAG